MKRSIITNQNDATQAYGLEVKLLDPSVTSLLTLPNGGIVRFPALQDSQKGMVI